MTKNTQNASDASHAHDTIRTHIEVEKTEDDCWKATEPAAESNLYGRGKTPPEAVKHYAELVMGDSNGV